MNSDGGVPQEDGESAESHTAAGETPPSDISVLRDRLKSSSGLMLGKEGTRSVNKHNILQLSTSVTKRSPDRLMDVNYEAFLAYFEQDAVIREKLREESCALELKLRSILGLLAKTHSTPNRECAQNPRKETLY